MFLALALLILALYVIGMLIFLRTKRGKRFARRKVERHERKLEEETRVRQPWDKEE